MWASWEHSAEVEGGTKAQRTPCESPYLGLAASTGQGGSVQEQEV
jgi:hypothetical protein